MAEALLIVSNPGPDGRWPLARVAGLAAVERNLMALRSVGVQRVRVACGPAEYGVLQPHFHEHRPDARLPLVTVTRLDASTPGDLPVLDGRRVYHPELLRLLVEAGGQAHDAPPVAQVSGPPGQAAGGVAVAQPPGGSRVAQASVPAGRNLYQEDITTPGGRRRARRAIRQSLRKPTDGWFARTIDRSLSLAISAALAPFPVHPNLVTLATLLVGVAAGVLAARGTYAGFVAAGALFLLASVLDGVDGELARMKFQGSNAGQWLDTVCDDLTNAVYLAGVTVGAWRALASRLLVWTGVAAVALDLVTVAFLYWQLLTTVNARTLLAFEETILAPALRQPGLAGLVARLQPFIKRDVYAPLFLVFALAGVAWLSLPATAIALAITLAFLLRDLAKARGARAGAKAA